MDRQAQDAQRETGNRIPHMLTGCFRGMLPTSEPACQEIGWGRGTISVRLRTIPRAKAHAMAEWLLLQTMLAQARRARNQPSPHFRN
ncbi:uncharacterized protein TrAFT101_002699 [Trichoderma asperellum]|uniref:uncharacterized protein n=1 Tax=Trichoderma asperellum TaxID=101201 RepID=UPI003325ADED|nr:hypothetical protein TrAFT101_002699 [Trichoderma asperellum]